jgi:glycosyltransferase involved in cell wall biosynthesis
MGLPADKILIGYCGAIYTNRGINILFDAYKILQQNHKNIELILSGRKGPGITIPDGARWLGYIPDEDMPDLLNSMDVLTVINKSSLFGNYSYPIKLYEAMCCQVPVVASATLSTQWILDGFPDLLTVPNDSMDLSQRIAAALQYNRIDYGHQQGWEDSADVLEKALEENLHS